MTRLTTVAACLAVTALASAAHAQSQAEIAAKLNEEGKTLMFANKFAEATAKFRAAVARVPEPGYFVNLCTSLFQEGKFGEALTACNAVANNNPTPDQRAKADRLTARVKEEAKAQNVPVEPLGGGGGDPMVDCGASPDDPRCQGEGDICKSNPQDPSCAPANPNTNPDPARDPRSNPVTNDLGPANQPRYAVGRPPSGTGVFAATTPDNKYIWTLGIDLFGGGGQVGQADYYGQAAAGFRIKGDYLLNPSARFGAQGYLQLTHFGQGEMDLATADTLDIVDVGVALYKHLCPRGTSRLCLTPLAGAHLAMMSPAGEEDGAGEQVFNYAAVGGRVELGAHFAFGSRQEHVLGVIAGVNFYSSVISDSGEYTPALIGLDKGGAAAYLGLGYTHRFRTPLGSAPFITLE